MLGTANNIISNSNLAANGMDDYKVPQKLTQPREKLIISGDSVSQPVVLAHQRLGSRSQGDDTTRGATAILIPIVTAKVEEELATAKDIVESLRIVGVIEDEAWDTAMVAEYEGEIFSYMIELEVGLCHPIAYCFTWRYQSGHVIFRTTCLGLATLTLLTCLL
jgi:hypothetical protein